MTLEEAMRRLEERLPLAAGAPEGCELAWEWPAEAAGTDALGYQIWRVTGAVWLHVSGGVAGVDVWRGPGTLADAWVHDALSALMGEERARALET